MSEEQEKNSEEQEQENVELSVVAPSVSETEAFLLAIESKTSDEAHKRLLKAARGSDPLKSLESELKAIATEILYENK